MQRLLDVESHHGESSLVTHHSYRSVIRFIRYLALPLGHSAQDRPYNISIAVRSIGFSSKFSYKISCSPDPSRRVEYPSALFANDAMLLKA